MSYPNQRVAMGIDPSLNSTGISLLRTDRKTGEIVTADTKALTHLMDISRADKLDRIYAYIYATVRESQPEVICIEDYAYGAKNGRETSGEVRGVISLALLHAKAPAPLLVAPMQLKHFATGSAKADKSQVRLAVYKRWGFEAPSDDEVDACVLSHIALAHMRPDIRTALTEYQQSTLKKILAPKVKKERAKK